MGQTQDRRPCAPRASFTGKVSTGGGGSGDYIENQDSVDQNARFKIMGYGSFGDTEGTHAVVGRSYVQLMNGTTEVTGITHTKVSITDNAGNGIGLALGQPNLNFEVDGFGGQLFFDENAGRIDANLTGDEPIRLVLDEAKPLNCAGAQLVRADPSSGILAPAWNGTKTNGVVVVDGGGNVGVSSATDLGNKFILNQTSTRQTASFNINGRGTWSVDGDETIYIDPSVIHLEDHGTTFPSLDIRSDYLKFYNSSAASCTLGITGANVLNSSTQARCGFSLSSHFGPYLDFPELYARSGVGTGPTEYISVRPGVVEFGEVNDTSRSGFYVDDVKTVYFDNLSHDTKLKLNRLELGAIPSSFLMTDVDGIVQSANVALDARYRRNVSPINYAFSSNGEGKVWQTVTTEAVQYFSVIYGDDVLIALSIDGTNRILRSVDRGTTWVSQPSPENNQWRDVAYGSGVFVGVSLDGTNRVMRSDDRGITWSSVLVPLHQYAAIQYGAGVFIAVSVNDGYTIRSVDGGVTWTEVRTNSASLRDICYGDGVFIATPTIGAIQRSTDDGMTWTPVTAQPDVSYRGVIYGNGVFVAVASSTTSSIIRSLDGGVTWVAANRYTIDNTTTCPAYGNGVFIVASTSGLVQRSVDNGATWNTVTTPVSNQWRAATYCSGAFYIFSNNGGTTRAIRSVNTVIREDIMQSLPITNASPGVITLVSGGLKTFGFSGGNTTGELFYHIDSQHDYIAGTNKTFHVHWISTSANSGDVKWQVEYSWVEAGGIWGAPTLLSGITSVTGTSWQDMRTDFVLPGAGKTYNSRIVLRLFRNGGDAQDTYPDNAALTSVGTHYFADVNQ